MLPTLGAFRALRPGGGELFGRSSIRLDSALECLNAFGITAVLNPVKATKLALEGFRPGLISEAVAWGGHLSFMIAVARAFAHRERPVGG